MKKPIVSEIALLFLLVLLVASMRIYIGEPGGFIWVWKGEPGFNDTIVDLKEVVTMPREDLKQNHSDVMWQLEDMGLIEESSEHAKWRERLHKRKAGQVTIQPNY